VLPSALLNPPDHQSQHTKWHPISSWSPKAPANKAFKRKVCDGWHQARQNFATDPCPQAISPGEVVSALGQTKLGTAPLYDIVHPEFLKHLQHLQNNIV